MDNLEFIRFYPDNFLIIKSSSFEENLSKVKEAMKWLQSDGLKCKINKCNFAVSKVEYLVYIIMCESIKPDPKQIEAIINLERPKNKTQVGKFLGMIQYYRSLWPNLS